MNEAADSKTPTKETISYANVGVDGVVRPVVETSGLLRIIDGLRETDPAIAAIFTNGGCYQFAKYLQSLYPQGELITNWNFDHVRFLIGGVAYDIEGMPYHEHHNWHVMTEHEMTQAEEWSFSKQRMIKIGECPVCDEPLLA